MAGLLELFARYVDEIGGDPIADAANHARSDVSRDRVERDAAAMEIERIGQVLGLGGGDR